MSALCQKRTYAVQQKAAYSINAGSVDRMRLFVRELVAEMDQHRRDVRFVPKADSCSAAKSCLFDHLVGEQLHRNRYVEAKRLCGLEVDH